MPTTAMNSPASRANKAKRPVRSTFRRRIDQRLADPMKSCTGRRDRKARPRSLEKWKEFPQLRLVGLAAVFADLEGLGVLHIFGGVTGIPGRELFLEAGGD